MAQDKDMRNARRRAGLFLLGGLAALALWALGENWDNPALGPTLYLLLFSFVAVYAAVALALAGPVRMRQALAGALLVALPVTGLVHLAGRRHLTPTDLLDEPVTLSVIGVLVFFATPFLSVWLESRRDWLRYAALFQSAWTMTVRYAAAWIFVSIFWLLAFLSDALLNLVGIDAIDRVIRTDWARFGLSGGVLGLALAVVYELRGMISPYPVLRLLRLLVPPVLVVVSVFVVAVSVGGLSELFGEVSAAATLMGAAMVAITLISAALDSDDAGAVRSPGLRLTTRLLAGLLPALAVLAVWAVALRVRQYGWTPDRVLAATAAGFLMAYALGYSAAAVLGGGWMARIRSINVTMALAVIAVAMLWMTPVLDVYRISTASQLSRFDDGRSELDQLALWQFAHGWGRPGVAALERLERMTERADHAELVARIAAARAEPNASQFDYLMAERRAPEQARALADILPVRPAGSALQADALAGVPLYRIEQWLAGCRQSLPDGRPGCVLIRGAFLAAADAGAQAMILYLDASGRGRGNHVMLHGDGIVSEVYNPVARDWPVLAPELLGQALDGRFDIRPSGGRALWLGDAVLVPVN